MLFSLSCRGNTRGDNVVGVYEDESIEEYVSGLSNPDHIRIVGDYLYVTVGYTNETSNMYRKNIKTGHVDTAFFMPGGDLLRPYGFDFYKDKIYVASFLTDKILMYDMYTGAYLGIFAQGDGTEEGLVNGPNHIAIYNDKLYLTTQGSVATNGEPVYGLSSQIVVFDIYTGEGQVFAPPPVPLADSLGFVSMLGIQIYCPEHHEACLVYTTDFAGGLRVYSLQGELLYEVSTTDASGAASGALSITADGEIFVPGFVDEATDGVVQRFSAVDGMALPRMDDGLLFAGPSEKLVRPIGVYAFGSSTYASKMSKNSSKGASRSSGMMMKRMKMMGKGKGDRVRK